MVALCACLRGARLCVYLTLKGLLVAGKHYCIGDGYKRVLAVCSAALRRVHCGSPVLRAYRKVQSVGMSYMLTPQAGASTLRVMEKRCNITLYEVRLVRNAEA